MWNRRQFVKGVSLLPLLSLVDAEANLRDGAPFLPDYGVASGDPRPDSVIIWTRVPEYAQPRDFRGAVRVRYYVSLFEEFLPRDIVASGEVTTDENTDYTVQVTVEGLSPWTRYYYRFVSESGYESLVGRTKTAPSADQDLSEMKFAFVSCQNFVSGYFTPFAHLRHEDVDFCIHLGDHIYETNGAGPGVKTAREDNIGGGEAKSLVDYRNKYKLALSDKMFREVRRLFPWISLWDDHEVANNYTSDGHHKPDARRKLDAYKAFYEYIPRATPLVAHEAFRDFQFGKLGQFFALDERQYRDNLACYVEGKRDMFIRPCPEKDLPERTLLGASQKTWLKEKLAQSECQWKFVLNEVMMMQFKFAPGFGGPLATKYEKLRNDQDGIFFSFDGWDGFSAERADLLAHVRKNDIRNFVVLTGDIHNFYAGVLREDFGDKKEEPVGVEIVGGSVTSAGFYEVTHSDLNLPARLILPKLNPHLRYLDMKHHGYVKARVTPEAAKFEFLAVDTVLEERSRLSRIATVVVENNVPEAKVED